MRNSDLIAYLKPIASRFSGAEPAEFIDVAGQVGYIRANSYRLAIRLNLAAGLYRGRLETKRGAFDMSTAMIGMVRVPDGKRVLVGPWDLDHIHNVMAVPMAKMMVNSELKGGLWFAMPGPDQIAEGRLTAEFGFEAQDGENELTLELVERDRERMRWSDLAFLELRADDRNPVPLLPANIGHPRVFLSPGEVNDLRSRWSGRPEFEALQARLRTEDLTLLSDNSQGTLAVALLMYALTGDALVGERSRTHIMKLAKSVTWSGRPDPLLMGGDNDRGISLRLYHCALGWDYLQPLLNQDERRALLLKVEEYLQKIYDFTVLQRSYLGCPAIDPHSLGGWNGAAIACMAFYDDLAIARRALPFFHGLFCDSLKLFPASGKAAWATYFPFHLVLYLAAAHTFGGQRPELARSAFLDHLGNALLACYEVPNSQELQRGLRTREHRFLTAYLNRFHPTPGIDAIYRAFFEREKKTAGDVTLGVFDLLYAPSPSGPVAAFPDRPLFAKDVGDIIAISRGAQTIAVSINGGPKSGRRASFSLMPHNREFPPSLGALEMTIDGLPVLCNINMGVYGLDSALTNTMCFEEGGALTNGQYLNGDIPPDKCAQIRRCLIGKRYVYAHIVITDSLNPTLGVHEADRIFVFDQKTGVVVLADSFQGARAIRYATHLHCSGSVRELEVGHYRLSGGQANLIAGIKGGSKGLDDSERGEAFVKVIKSSAPWSVVVEEPIWVPAYIYGLNHTGKEEVREGRFPRYQRWRLQTSAPVDRGSFVTAISPQPDQVHVQDGAISFPNGSIQFGYGRLRVLDYECECECLLWDETSKTITAIGLQSWQHGNLAFSFEVPVDMEYLIENEEGMIFAPSDLHPQNVNGFDIDAFMPVEDESWRTSHPYQAAFRNSAEMAGKGKSKA